MLGLQWLVGYTKMGKAMRAVSEDKEVSALMGIDIDKVIVFTFAIGGVLAGAAGVINGLYRPQGVWFYMGFYPGIKAFTAAVLGGIGSVPGAMLGGLFLGVIESVGPNLILDGSGHPRSQSAERRIRLRHAGTRPDLPATGHRRRTTEREESVDAVCQNSSLDWRQLLTAGLLAGIFTTYVATDRHDRSVQRARHHQRRIDAG